MNFVFDDWTSSKQRDVMGEKDAYRKTNDDTIDCIRYYYQARLNYHGLKHAMQLAEKRQLVADTKSNENKFKIQMPGLPGRGGSNG